MARGRQEKVGIGFMIVWLVLWASGMMIAVFTLGGAAWAGDLGAALFLFVWLAAAGVGLAAGARKLRGLLFGGEAPRKPPPARDWNDGIPGKAGSASERSDPTVSNGRNP